MESDRDESVEQQEEKAGYPDISKANTKVIVILSFLFVLLIFLLSVFMPEEKTEEKKAAPKQSESTCYSYKIVT